jgi:hypothetical protein
MNARRILGLLVVVLCLGNPVLFSQDSEDPYRIRIGAADLTPREGERASPGQDKKHHVIQFYEIPHSGQRLALEEKGMVLLRYLGGNAYLARLDTGYERPVEWEGIRATLVYAPEMKHSRLFWESDTYRQAFRNGESVAVYVRFFTGVVYERAAVDWRSFRALLESDDVEWVDVALPPRRSDNQDSAALTHVDVVRLNKAYKSMSGKGIRVGLWDGGPVGPHVDFDGRVTIVENDNPVSDHATHVAGTIAGKGILDSRGAGMAPRALIFSYDFSGNILSEILAAHQNYDVSITNHSWGHPVGWVGPSGTGWHWYGDELFGYYHGETGAVDHFIRTYDIPFVKSAGNLRDGSYLGPHRHEGDVSEFHQDLHPPNPDFGCLSILSVAKNAIVVGAVMKDKVITDFSSTGPTGDGRVKPDLVAPGFKIRSTMPDDTYSSWTGTSMSAPAVTGISALLMDYYQRLTGNRMGACLLKNLLVHTGEDLGNPGPDYVFGHGLADAEFAARVLKAAAASGKAESQDDLLADLRTGSVDHKEMLAYEFVVPPGAEEMRATLVWNDPSGDRLINNLDLWLRQGGSKKIKPLVLNPKDPPAPAVRKRNRRDNVEHIRMASPEAGTWKVGVKGQKIPQGPQEFTLIVSAGSGNRPFEVQAEGTIKLRTLQAYTTDSQGQREKTGVFSRGDALLFNYAGEVMSNAEYGRYYGTVSIDIYVYDSFGALILKFKDSRSDFGSGKFSLWSEEYEIPESMPAGNFRVETSITMHNGTGAQVSTLITVQQ